VMIECQSTYVRGSLPLHRLFALYHATDLRARIFMARNRQLVLLRFCLESFCSVSLVFLKIIIFSLAKPLHSAIKFKRWLSNVLWQLATPSLFPNRTVEDILKACKDKLFVGIFLEGLSISQLYWLLLLRFESLIL